MMNNDLFRHAASSSLGAAVLLALAACGSGDGGAPAAQQPADGGAVVKAEVASGEATQGAQTSQAQNDVPAAQTNAAQGGAANDVASSDEPKTMTEPISKESVRGDVLATALTQEITVPAQNGKGESHQVNMGPSEHTLDQKTKFRYEHTLKKADAGSSLGTFVYEQATWPSEGPKSFSSDRLRVSFGLSGGESIQERLASSEEDAELLKIGRSSIYVLDYLKNDGSYEESEKAQLETDLERVIRKNEAIPVRVHTLAAWKGERQAVISLYINSGEGKWGGDLSRQFSVCTYVEGLVADNYIPSFARSTCSTWEVPQSWQPGSKLIYKGQSMVHTRWDMIVDSDGRIYDFLPKYGTWLGNEGPAD